MDEKKKLEQCNSPSNISDVRCDWGIVCLSNSKCLHGLYEPIFSQMVWYCFTCEWRSVVVVIFKQSRNWNIYSSSLAVDQIAHTTFFVFTIFEIHGEISTHHNRIDTASTKQIQGTIIVFIPINTYWILTRTISRGFFFLHHYHHYRFISLHFTISTHRFNCFSIWMLLLLLRNFFSSFALDTKKH